MDKKNENYPELRESFERMLEALDENRVTDVFSEVSKISTMACNACINLGEHGSGKGRKKDCNTKISFLYRDAGNYKVHNEVIVSGKISKKEQKEILGLLDCGEFFIPEKIGLSCSRFDEFTEDDTMFCEMNKDSFSYTDQLPTEMCSAKDVVEAFRKTKGKWY